VRCEVRCEVRGATCDLQKRWREACTVSEAW